MRHLILLTAAMTLPLSSQEIQFPASLDKLAEKAEEVVNVSLDPTSLGLARRALSAEKSEEVKAKQFVEGLKGIYVRSFKFASAGQYSDEDIAPVRKQLETPGWQKIVSVRSKKKDGDNAEIWLKKEGDRIAGLTILAAEPAELTIVHIAGEINPDDLGKLGGSFGIPNIKMGPVKEKQD
jgi:hypothetical protein